MPSAARITDLHTCPLASPNPHVGGPITGPGVPTVLIGNLPAAVIGDLCTCAGPPDSIVKGSITVLYRGETGSKTRRSDSTWWGNCFRAANSSDRRIIKKKIMITPHNSFLGTGWSFPPTFDRDSGQVEMVSDLADIEQSLDILLSTSLGERVMVPDYGCNLDDYMFESLSNNLIGLDQASCGKFNSFLRTKDHC
jgi:uncharacterized Zn-binding protein involved in type VI secretion